MEVDTTVMESLTSTNVSTDSSLDMDVSTDSVELPSTSASFKVAVLPNLMESSLMFVLVANLQ